MNCLKSVRFLRDYGTIRITIVSTVAAIAFFTLFYVMFLYWNPYLQFNRFSLLIFLAVLILVYPVHKLFHCLPVWLCGHKAKMSAQWKTARVPMISCELRHPVPRNLFIASVAFPGVVMTMLFVASAVMMPNFFYYICVGSAINFGMSVTDWIYLAFLIKAPAYTYIEDFSDGFHILIQTTAPSFNKKTL